MTWLTQLNRNLVLAIPAFMLAGFAFGYFADARPLKAAIVPLTFLMVYPMMVNLKIRKVFEGGDTKTQLVTQAINFGVIPFAAYAMGMLFFPERPYMALGLLLAALVPTSGMTISWTGFAKGNLAAAVKMTGVGLTLGSIATPFYVQFPLGTQVALDIFNVIRQIVLIVFLPMAAGFLTQRMLVRKQGETGFQQRWAPRFPPLSTLGVLGIVFVAVSLKARAIAAAPDLLLTIFVPLLLLYGVNFALSTAVGKVFLPRGDAIALVYGTVMRNLSIALAVAINAFGPQGSDAALVLCVAYIVQVQAAAWYVKFTDRIFGPVQAKVLAAEPA